MAGVYLDGQAVIAVESRLLPLDTFSPMGHITHHASLPEAIYSNQAIVYTNSIALEGCTTITVPDILV